MSKEPTTKEPARLVSLAALAEGRPHRAELECIPLVVVRAGSVVNVLYGRCPHRSADLCCGTIEGPELVCNEHGWAFELKTGLSQGLPGVSIRRFDAWVDEETGVVMVDAADVRAFREDELDTFAYDL